MHELFIAKNACGKDKWQVKTTPSPKSSINGVPNLSSDFPEFATVISKPDESQKLREIRKKKSKYRPSVSIKVRPRSSEQTLETGFAKSILHACVIDPSQALNTEYANTSVRETCVVRYQLHFASAFWSIQLSRYAYRPIGYCT